MTPSPDTLAHSAFYTDTARKLREASTEAQLTAIARILDSDPFHALPEQVQDDLSDLYRSRMVTITGSLTP